MAVHEPDDAIVVANSIEKRFGGVHALRGANLTLRRGSICGLLGSNGSGKSTFSNVLCGIHEPNAGTVAINGELVRFHSPQQALDHGLAMVHQHLSLVPDLTVWENIMLGHEHTFRSGRIDDRACRDQAVEALSAFSETVAIDRVVGELSTAHRQIVEIAKAVVLRPQILILDEPTASLELGEVRDVFDAMNKLKESGVSMIFTSHRMWEVMEICDYAVIFRNGSDVGVVETLDAADAEGRIVSMIVGSDVGAPPVPSRNDAVEKLDLLGDSEPILELRDARIPRGRKLSVDTLSLTVKPGEIVGLAGIHGQGQEELLLCIAGDLPFLSGRCFVDGVELVKSGTRIAVSKGIALVPGDRNEEGLFTGHDMSVNGSFPRIVNGDHGWFVRSSQRLSDAVRIIEKMGIVPADPHKPVRQFSGGNAQKIVVGKWYIRTPRVLLLSDPAKGVDIRAKDELYAAVQDLAQKGTGVLLYASDNRELVELCDRVYVMFEGGIVAELGREEIGDDRITEVSLRPGVAHVSSAGRDES